MMLSNDYCRSLLTEHRFSLFCDICYYFFQYFALTKSSVLIYLSSYLRVAIQKIFDCNIPTVSFFLLPIINTWTFWWNHVTVWLCDSRLRCYAAINFEQVFLEHPINWGFKSRICTVNAQIKENNKKTCRESEARQGHPLQIWNDLLK